VPLLYVIEHDREPRAAPSMRDDRARRARVRVHADVLVRIEPPLLPCRLRKTAAPETHETNQGHQNGLHSPQLEYPINANDIARGARHSAGRRDPSAKAPTGG